MTEPDVAGLAPALADNAQAVWASIMERADTETAAALQQALAGTDLARECGRALACSRYVAEQARRNPATFSALLNSGDLAHSLTAKQYAQRLAEALDEPTADPMAVLRRFRNREMLRIVWRDFCRSADTRETIADTSALADTCIAAAQSLAMAQLQARHGIPRGRSDGAEQNLVVLAMGKLGAAELNVSSDIDLIFAFPEAGETDHPDKPLSNEEFFTRLGRAIIKLLDQPTADGFAFRVDMRLRPYGESGALVHNFTALEEYYQDQGRDWERYAMIKARPVTGGEANGQTLMSALRPFVYRRYVDFGVIESLRSMKQMIQTEVRRKGLQDNVKLGSGGIRDVEFIAQCLQLIRGGRDTALQRRERLPVLDECERLGSLPPGVAKVLRDAYLFLRDSEHAIQGFDDRQSQTLPGDELPRLAMATLMGCDSWDDYLSVLESHRERVAQHFSELIAEPGADAPEDAEELLPWDASLDAAMLAKAGYRQSEDTLARLDTLRESRKLLSLQSEGRERLHAFMPRFLKACLDSEDPDRTLARLLPLVTAVVRRSAYLALLLENPRALQQLVLLGSASPWIATQLERSPVLLDELLDSASLYSAPDREALENELQQQVLRLPIDDLEAQMDALRYFKASHVLRVAASELGGQLPLMQVSDKLTFLAEVILGQVIAIAWADLVAKYGEPDRQGDGYGFAIFGYGKLGGIELGHGSDLDLVFVQDSASQGVTSGPRQIDNVMFYTRLGQRIIHILETRMMLGQLYEVDMRLRPSGASGMLVTTCEGFRSYQSDSAWTWEHQALVRARFVAGDATVAARVDEVRRDVLCRERDLEALRHEVLAMRSRMREHLLPARCKAGDLFHLKQGEGGIVDIEFMVQYGVLAWAYQVPELVRWSDNVRLLETLAQKSLFDPADCELLTEAYLAYRSASHQLALQQIEGVVPANEFVPQREAVRRCWDTLLCHGIAGGNDDKELNGETHEPG